MFNFGDEVLITESYGDNDSIINKTGTIIAKNDCCITVYFHENIEGHDGGVENNVLLMFAKKYNTRMCNCWNFRIDKCNNIIKTIKKTNGIIKTKWDLYTKANINLDKI